mgnify:CR=1 FL=1
MKVRFSTIILNLIVIMTMLISGANLLFSIGLLIWLNIFIYALRDYGNRSMLLAFMISFFVFLMGRDLVQQLFLYKVENFTDDINSHLYISIIFSLLSLLAGYVVCNYFERYSRKNLSFDNSRENTSVDPFVKNISKYLFYVSWIFAITSKLIVARYVSSFGYSEYYTDFSEYLYGNTFLYIVSKLEGVMPVALSIFSATLPTKKEYRIPVLMYIAYMLISLLSGQRSVFTLGILFLLVYFLYRNQKDPSEKWVTRKMVVLAIIAIPILSVFMTIFSNIRMGEQVGAVTLTSGVMDFLYDQGVTGNVIKRAFMYKNQIPKQIYSLEFIHSGIFARIFGIHVYHGNTVEHAMYGGSFTHALGYIVLGPSYLAGRGTGSSYVAELFQDFGYFGIIIGNIMYGYIIARINRPITKNNVLKMSIRYYIITQILWAPRASLTGFLANLFAPLTIVAFLFVFSLAKLFKSKYKGVN